MRQAYNLFTMRTEPVTARRDRGVTIKTEVDPALGETIRRKATEDGRSVSNYLRHILVKTLDPEQRQR